MRYRIRISLVCIVAVAWTATCATRPNPDLPPAGGDADADDDGCGEGRQLCGDDCVSLDHQDHCGGCDRACSTEGGCICDGDPPACIDDNAGHFCFEACSPGELLCGEAGAEQCARSDDTPNCGACGVVCDSASACNCLDPGSTGLYECLRRDGSGWADCTESVAGGG